MKKNINRSRKYEDTVQILAVKNHPTTERSIFPTIRELMCFAAVLGFSRGEFLELDPKAGVEDIQSHIFANFPDAKRLVYLIALAHKRNVEILGPNNDREMVDIFERYANGGLKIMQGWLSATPQDPHGAEAIFNGLRELKFLGADMKTTPNVDDVVF